MKDNTTITVSRDTHKKLSIIKINSDAKNLDEVIQEVVKLKENSNGR